MYPISLDKFSDLANIITKETWSPSIYNHNHRTNANQLSTNLLVLDYDKGIPSLNEMAIQMQVEGYRHMIGVTRSHQEKGNGDRYRVIIATNGQPALHPEQYKSQMVKIMSRWPIPDDSCKDFARYFFPCREIVSIEDGKLFEWPGYDSLEIIEDRKKRRTSKVIVQGSFGVLPNKTRLFLNKGKWEVSRRNTCVKAAADLGRLGWQLDKTLSVVFNAPKFKDELEQVDIDDLPRQIENGWNLGRADYERYRESNTDK